MSHQVISFKTYLNVIISLFLLTILTIVASRVDFGSLNLLIAMGIATVKATLVLLYFMHLKYDDKTYLVIFLTSVSFVILMFMFFYFDIMTRVNEVNVL